MKHQPYSKAKKLINRLLMRIAKPAYMKPPPDIAPAIIEPSRPETAIWQTEAIKTAKRIKPPPGAGKAELEDHRYAILQIRLTKRLLATGVNLTDTPPPIIKPKANGRFMDNIGKVLDYSQPTPTRHKHIHETA